MESASRSSEDEDEFGRRQSSSHQDLIVKVDGKNSEQKPGTPTTPRSKHSAMEQRRRCKINDRFQILRDLIPHSDQKRDKATFLLEVIEYVKFLQEKVQKFESYPEWNQENAKLTPWSNSRVPADGISDLAHANKNGPAPGFTFSGKFVDNSIPVAPTMLSNAHNVGESDMSTGTPSMPVPLQPNMYATVGGGGFIQTQQPLISDSDNMASQSQSQWQRSSCPTDCTVSSDMGIDQEELAIDEGTITMSSIYSQNLFAALTHAMESSGIDLSQANVTVQVNLGKRATRRPTSTTTMSNAKDRDVSPANQTMEDSGAVGEESEQASKRQKADNS
ncbi:transcription factor BIM2-like [Typha angustifolia]|uniref:transcription factor BIM2-like n=1 Tax=Typha angustifolia TaxID=59011 RepID=UPI003C2E670D